MFPDTILTTVDWALFVSNGSFGAKYSAKFYTGCLLKVNEARLQMYVIYYDL